MSVYIIAQLKFTRRELYDRYQSRAIKANPRIPLLYGIDAVHGHNNVLGATIFPHNIGLGCTRNAAARRQMESNSTGVWTAWPRVSIDPDRIEQAQERIVRPDVSQRG